MLRGSIAELKEIQKAIMSAARGFQSYPVAREAMSRLSIRVMQRCSDQEAELKALELKP